MNVEESAAKKRKISLFHFSLLAGSASSHPVILVSFVVAKVSQLIASYRKLANDRNGIVPSDNSSKIQTVRPSYQKVLQVQSRGTLPAMLPPSGASRRESMPAMSMLGLGLTFPGDDSSRWEPKMLAELERAACQLL